MGKYMRRKRGGAAGDDGRAAPAAVVLGGGVRTRSRSAAAAAVVAVVGATASKRRRQMEAGTTATAAGSGCYLHLRSRRLFMPAVAARGDLVAEAASTSRTASSGAEEDAVPVGISRCSSTASTTVDVAARERSGGDAEACVSRDVESSVSDSQCGGRERRETTPSSLPPVDYSSDLDPSQETTGEHRHKRCRWTPATTATTTAAFRLQSRARMPAAAEIEEFFAAAEKAQAERFAAKYNFDVALSVPLNGAGRFEWTPVAKV